MAIPPKIRDELLVEAQHRCTICSERCFEVHHILEQSEGGTDEPDNLIVLCPNCHQHRYHRHKEFTPTQIRLYKVKLKESAEVEKRLLQNFEEIRAGMAEKKSSEVERELKTALQEAYRLVDPSRRPNILETIEKTTRDLGEAQLLPEAARRAIELHYDVEAQCEKAKFPEINVTGVDEDGWRKSDAFGRAYEFVLLLNLEPNHDWCGVFDSRMKSSFYMMRRETRIRGNRVTLIVADSDNLQSHVDWVKGLVNETNNWIFTRGFMEIDVQVGLAKRKALEEFDAIQSMKSKVKGIRI